MILHHGRFCAAADLIQGRRRVLLLAVPIGSTGANLSHLWSLRRNDDAVPIGFLSRAFLLCQDSIKATNSFCQVSALNMARVARGQQQARQRLPTIRETPTNAADNSEVSDSNFPLQ